VATSTGSRRERSIRTPAMSPNSRYGSQRAELTSPTSVESPCIVLTMRTWIAKPVT
jgi:hypothetical protein